MLFTSLLQALSRRSMRRSGPAARQTGCRNSFHCRRAFLPRIEALEERTLLSTLTVVNTADSGPGSLRATIAGAAAGDTIVFNHALAGQTITLTSGELTIATPRRNSVGAVACAASGPITLCASMS